MILEHTYQLELERVAVSTRRPARVRVCVLEAVRPRAGSLEGPGGVSGPGGITYSLTSFVEIPGINLQ